MSTCLLRALADWGLYLIVSALPNGGRRHVNGLRVKACPLEMDSTVQLGAAAAPMHVVLCLLHGRAPL